jgi:hypothetical protein
VHNRVLGSVVLGGGLLIILAALANGLFSAAPAIERLTDDFRSSFTAGAITTARTDLARLETARAELQARGATVLTGPLGTTPEQFDAVLQARYPKVATGLAELPAITKEFSGLVGLMDVNRGDFALADAVPSKSLPATTVPWILTGSGLVFVGLGLWLLRGADPQVLVATAASAGLVVVTGLALSLPQKADATGRLVKSTKGVFTETQAASAAQAVETIGGMGQQLTGQLIPDVASRLRLSSEQVVEQMNGDLPAVGAALAQLQDSGARFQDMSARLTRNLDNYRDAARPDLAVLVSIQLLIAVLVFGLSVGALALATRRLAADQSAPAPMQTSGPATA